MALRDNPLLKEVFDTAEKTHQPLDAEWVYELVRFRKAGGIGRLCQAIADLSKDYCAQRSEKGWR